MEDFKQETEYLKSLIRQVGDTGSAAWIARQHLSDIRRRQSYKQMSYNTFEKYCKTEFNIAASTAYVYIKIYENYDEADTKGILISYLKSIAEEILSKEKRVGLINVLRQAREDVSSILLNSSLNDIKNQEYKSEAQFERDTKKIFIQNKRKSASKKQQEKNYISYGKELKSTFLPNLALQTEPIDEMGVVALFCLIFDSFKNNFVIENEELKFYKIKLIQAPFPDAWLVCELNNNKKEKCRDIFAEFEYESYEYINHKHHKSKKAKDCKLIICWEDNAKKHFKRKNYPEVINMPPVFELKDYLMTGEIKLLR